MLEKLKGFVQEYNMFERGEEVVLGVSGGADSVCLLLCLEELQKIYDLGLTVVHVNHGIRGDEALRDQHFVEEICAAKGIECRVFEENVPEYSGERGLSEEEAGREIRYIRFVQICQEKGCKKIAVAHNANDQTETIIFNMLRGSSLTGACGMRPVGTLNNGEDILIVRPLLETDRKEIEAFLLKRNISWCQDSTNFGEEYSRNYIRNTLIPAAEKISPRAGAHIRMLGSDIREAEDFVDYETEKYYNRCCDGNTLLADACEELPDFLVKRIIYRFICDNAGRKKDIQRIHILNVFELLKKEVGKSVDLPYDITVKRDYTSLVVQKRTAGQEKTELFQKIDISEAGESRYDFGNGRTLVVRCFPYEKNSVIPKEKFKVWFDPDKIGQKLVVRTPEEGDYFCPYTDGRKKKLNRLFIEEKLSADKREKILLVACGNRCLWIPGMRRDEALRLDENSTRVLEFELV
ncbi:MAG: tRNA lysidine(34) synthetase TilS [Lachnospiraceae bacterium]